MTPPTERLFHLALGSEWSRALATGTYPTSTLGRTVADEGFAHCSHAHQVAAVAARFYADVAEPLVLLEIDPSRLTSPVVEEVPPGGAEAFPHVHGTIDVPAVVAAHPLDRTPDGVLVLPPVVTSSAGSDPSR